MDNSVNSLVVRFSLIFGLVLVVASSALAQEKLAKSNTSDSVETEVEQNPYIEVEKFDAGKINEVTYSIEDKVSLYTKAHFNNLAVKDRNTFSTFTLNTSTDTEAGFEYFKFISKSINVYARLGINQFAQAETTAVSPAINSNLKNQGTGGLGMQFLFSQNNLIGLGLNFAPHYYLEVSPNGRLDLNAVSSGSVNFATEFYFFSSNDLNVGFNFGADYISNAKTTGNGLAYEIGAVYLQDFAKKDSLRVKLAYIQTNLDSASYTLVDNTISLQIGYSLPR